MKTPVASLDDYAALDPFFRIIEQGLDGLAGPGHSLSLSAAAAGAITSQSFIKAALARSVLQRWHQARSTEH